MQPLPAAWVDSLFARLAVRYGSSWTRLWEGLDMAAVKDDWAECLSAYAKRPEAIEHALDNLPNDRPPIAPQFALLCRNAPQLFRPQLPPPEATPQRRMEVQELLKQARERMLAAKVAG